MLGILGMIILIIILSIIIILSTGIKIRFEYVKNNTEFKGYLKILILKKIKIYTLKFPSTSKDAGENKKKTDFKKIFKLAKPCMRNLLDYLKTIVKSIKISKIENHIIFGMENFADTGKYIGIIWAALAIINSLDENIKISAKASFTGDRLDGEGINDLEIYPLKILIPTIRLIRNEDMKKLIKGVLDER